MKLGELLVSRNRISARDVERALAAQTEMGGYLGQVLVKLGLVSELDLAQALSIQLDTPLVAADAYPEEALRLSGLSQDFLANNLVVPLSAEGERARFAAAIPQDAFITKALALATGKDVELVLGLESDILAALQRFDVADGNSAVEDAELEAGGDHFKTDGMRARWGYFNEDDSGMMLTGWFGTEASDRFQFGHDAYNGIIVDQEFILNNSPAGGSAFLFPRNGALPLTTRDDFLDTGLDPLSELTALGFTGIATKFDVLFQYDVTSRAAGGALHWYHEPIYKRKWVTVRPAIGARYQFVDERFAFRGIDSGFGYDLTFGSGGVGGGGNQINSFRPDADSLFAVIDDAGNGFFYEANLNSQIDSHMAGPEAGLRYDFGSGKHFSIWGQSTFALLANHERINITGRNIGDPVNYWLVTGDNWADPTDGIDTSFKTTQTHTHASPMFEQSVFFDMDIFRYIPYLNKMHALSNARFRTGYTYTVIGAVARPGEVIEWNAFPDLPEIRGDQRKTWHTHNWSFAVDWEF